MNISKSRRKSISGIPNIANQNQLCADLDQKVSMPLNNLITSQPLVKAKTDADEKPLHFSQFPQISSNNLRYKP